MAFKTASKILSNLLLYKDCHYKSKGLDSNCSTLLLNNNNKPKDNMNKDVKAMKVAAEEAIEQILVELEGRGIKVFRLQVFTGRDRPPQVNIVVDEMGGNR